VPLPGFFTGNRFSRKFLRVGRAPRETDRFATCSWDHGHRQWRQDRACIGERDAAAALPVFRLWIVSDSQAAAEMGMGSEEILHAATA